MFHLENSFRSQNIYIFVLTFWSYKKNGLTGKIRLVSNFMTSQPGYQTITIHIFPNISQIKSNQTMKFGQLVKYNRRNEENHAENEAGN